MAELINRGMQRQILERLASAYPNPMAGQEFADLGPLANVRVNAHYLAELDLIGLQPLNFGGEQAPFASAVIRAKGIDFLADDGGLGAILGVVTVRLHEETVRDLLLQRVKESNAPSTVKAKVLDQLRALPAEGIKKLAEKALEAGIRGLPDAVQWIQAALS